MFNKKEKLYLVIIKEKDIEVDNVILQNKIVSYIVENSGDSNREYESFIAFLIYVILIGKAKMCYYYK